MEEGNDVSFVAAPRSLRLVLGGRDIVVITPDGHVVLADGYTPDAGATAFWEAVERAGLLRSRSALIVP